jgi:hypothetical protein
VDFLISAKEKYLISQRSLGEFDSFNKEIKATEI